jgi:hypothetical protein
MGRQLHTLRDAATFITELLKREHDTPAWRAAIEAPTLVASAVATPCCHASV